MFIYMYSYVHIYVFVCVYMNMGELVYVCMWVDRHSSVCVLLY